MADIATIFANSSQNFASRQMEQRRLDMQQEKQNAIIQQQNDIDRQKQELTQALTENQANGNVIPPGKIIYDHAMRNGNVQDAMRIADNEFANIMKATQGSPAARKDNFQRSWIKDVFSFDFPDESTIRINGQDIPWSKAEDFYGLESKRLDMETKALKLENLKAGKDERGGKQYAPVKFNYQGRDLFYDRDSRKAFDPVTGKTFTEEDLKKNAETNVFSSNSVNAFSGKPEGQSETSQLAAQALTGGAEGTAKAPPMTESQQKNRILGKALGHILIQAGKNNAVKAEAKEMLRQAYRVEGSWDKAIKTVENKLKGKLK